MQAAAKQDHDPLDTRRVDPYGWRLVPLIYSVGRDGIYDINVGGDYHFSGSPFVNGTGVFNQIGTPQDCLNISPTATDPPDPATKDPRREPAGRQRPTTASTTFIATRGSRHGSHDASSEYYPGTKILTTRSHIAGRIGNPSYSERDLLLCRGNTSFCRNCRRTRRESASTGRCGVTLVELLVIVGIVVLLAAISIPALRASSRGRLVREAAREVSVSLGAVQMLAMHDGRYAGVRIQRDPNLPQAGAVLYQVESPDPYIGDVTGAAARVQQWQWPGYTYSK